MRSNRGPRRCAQPHRSMMCVVASALAAAAVYAVLPAAQASANPALSNTGTAACAALTGLSLPDLPEGDTATVVANWVAGSGCQVAIEITDTSDPRGGDPGLIGIDLTLPDSWNGNYMAEGGGVYCGPASFSTLAGDSWLAAGYAISQTDCGHTGYANALISPWVCRGSTPVTQNCNPNGGLNWNRIDDFGYLSFHLEAVESKLIIDRYYSNRAQYSFWNGCSTGGRQGLSEAEKYPTDFNGILAGAPALNWDQFMVAQMWPQLVMEWNNDYLPTCKEDLVNTTLQAQCRDQDGLLDGVFDPRNCDVIGILRSLIGTDTNMFDYALAADNPNLSAFRAAGGKLIMWQGLADQLIFTGDSINFYNRAIAANGGIDRTEQFWRYFLAPGVAHCGAPGAGSVAPTNPMQQVIDWVEHGQAPSVLNASGSINGQAVTRPLCPYPDPDAVYTGGDPNQASSYTCRNSVQLDNPFQPGPAGNERRGGGFGGPRGPGHRGPRD
jgi:hypothetical protein